MMSTVDQIATPKLRAVLEYLGRAAAGYRLTEAPFVRLPPKTRPKTAQALTAKDYAVCSMILGTPAYKITSRGLRALADISVQIQKRPRKDGLCKNGCGRPVYVSPKGVKKSVCQVCVNDYCRTRYARTGHKYSPHKPCKGCGGKRHITAQGHVQAYCLTCQRAVNRRSMQAYTERLAQRVAEGDAVMCSRCHRAPVKVTVNGRVTPYCQACLAHMRTTTSRRTRMKAWQRKIATFCKKV